jgi:uncharacterized membrane protein
LTVISRYASFAVFAGLLLVLTVAGLAVLHPAQALLAGFDGAALVFLALMIRRARRDKADKMRARAARNAPDHHVMMALALLILAVVLTAVWVELGPGGGRRDTAVGLAVVTLALAWLFANSLFTLHYAHVWYLAKTPGEAGLDFPGNDDTPDYWDFAYFAFVLGMTFQVSDVTISTKRLRRIALGHAMLAFVFNIAVVALSVSLVGSALGG